MNDTGKNFSENMKFNEMQQEGSCLYVWHRQWELAVQVETET